MDWKIKIKDWSAQDWARNLVTFIIGWVLLFDLVGGIAIPLAYGQGCGWFAIPSAIVSAYAIVKFIRYVKAGNH